MGQQILLRLRPHFDPDVFLLEEQIVHTMLHEASNYPSRSSLVSCVLLIQLTHIVHGPHDDSFYNYLAGLESEYEDLKRSGYSGEGFHSPGTRLGVGTSHNLPPYLARIKALEAAEKRKNGSSGGGRRLGGGSPGQVGALGGRTQLTPRQLASRVSFVLSLRIPYISPISHCGETPIKLTDFSLFLRLPFVFGGYL